MHLHGASASLHSPASSLTLQEFLLAWKIFAPLPSLPNFPSPPTPNWPETIRPNVEHGTRPYVVVVVVVVKKETKLISSKLVPSLFFSYLSFRSRMISCGVEYWSVESWIVCRAVVVGERGGMGVRSIFVSSGNDTRNIVLIYRRETFLGELCIGI